MSEHHEHGHAHDKASFDDRAATWDDDPTKVARSEIVAAALAEAVPLSGSTRFLEYGAGTALLSQALRGRIGPLTVADTSSGMRDVMARKVADGALPGGTRVWDLDLATADVPDERFDVVATVMVLHHIVDLDAVLGAFARLVEPGGHLCIADLEAEDGSFHGADFGGHAGFEPDALAERLRAAGFADVTVRRDVLRVERPDGTFPLFLAVARR